MNRIIGILAMTLLIVTMLTATATLGGTIYVDDDGGEDYTNIQDAVTAASESDTIYVYSGIYYENVAVDKTITLMGENRDTTIVDGGGSGHVVYITADGVNISRLTVTNSGASSDAGIKIDNANYCCIENINASTNNGYGINCYYADNCLFINNYIVDNLVIGIYAYGGSNNEFAHNYVANNPYNGIQLADSGVLGPNWIHDNSFIGNGSPSAVTAGIFLWGSGSKNNLIENNLCDGNSDGIHFRAYGITGNIIRGNTISNSTGAGVRYTHSAGPNTFYHNNFINNAIDLAGAISTDIWDDGYPSGGNYWDTYTGMDNYSGPNQDIPGSDGVGDTVYIVTGGGQDNYPLMDPWSIVVPPIEAIEDVIEDVEALNLPQGIETSVLSKLDSATNALEKDKTTAAANILNACINQIEAQRGKKLTNEEADSLIAAIEQIINNINNE